VRPLQRSARSSCAEHHDSRDSLCRASPHAGRTTSRPVWLRVGPPSAASVRRRADAERSGQRALLFALQRVWDRPGIPGWNVDLRWRKRASYSATTTAAAHPVAQTLSARFTQDSAPGVGVVSDAVELRHVSGRVAAPARDYRIRRDPAPLAPWTGLGMETCEVSRQGWRSATGGEVGAHSLGGRTAAGGSGPVLCRRTG